MRTSKATALHMLTSTIEQRCFMLSESRLSRHREGQCERLHRETHQDMRSVEWKKKSPGPEEVPFLTPHSSESLGNKAHANNGP